MTIPARANPRRCGDRGWLVDITTGDPGTWARELRAQSWAPDLVEDVVPSDTSVLVVAKLASGMDDVHRGIASMPCAPSAEPSAGRSEKASHTVTIPVRYDGCDLAEVARHLGLSQQRVVDLHTCGTYSVGFFGFAPGFAYLRGLAAPLHLPRRADPRTRVDAGAVAIAGGYSVIYPGQTPGGWHIIGSTELVLWNSDDDPPNRLDVGDVVRFEAAT